MPTPIVPAEKAAVLAIVNVMDPVEADKLIAVLNNYEDVIVMVGRSLPFFEYLNSYLEQVLAPLDNAQLIIVGVYRAAAGPINNDPKLLWNSVVTGGATSVTVNNTGIALLGNTDLDKLTIAAGINLQYLYIGPGAKLRMLDATAAGSSVQNIFIRNMRSAPGELTAIAVGSNVNWVEVDEGAIFGGYTNNDPTAACAFPVTNLVASEETYNTIKLAWNAPGGAYILLNTFYKKSESANWILATNQVGDFIADGFIFRTLQPNTKYDFKVEVTCTNGGVASTSVSEITTCCQ